MTITEVSENQKLKDEIEKLYNNIDTYWLALNNEGVWLFISTLGCWSVSHKAIKIIALIITAGLFGYRIYQKNMEKRPFVKVVTKLEEFIKISIKAEDTRKARLFDLSEIKTKKLSLSNMFKRNIVFLICYAFWSASFIYEIRL